MLRALFLIVAGTATFLAVACSDSDKAPATGTPPPSTSPTVSPRPTPLPTNTLAPTPSAEPASPDAADTADIREAVFRYLFDHNASGAQSNASAYYISFGQSEGEPSADFIARFDGHVPVVKSHSEAIIEAGADSGNLVTDIATGKQGLLFTVRLLTMKGSDTATAEGGYYEASLSSSGSTFTVQRQGGVWVVTNERLNFIS